MEQYLDQKDGKWHLTMFIDIPRLLIKNKLNFRIYSITTSNGEIIRDPSFIYSKYIFSIAPSFLGKKVFFSSHFDTKEIEDVVEFKFGFCDEKIRWYKNTIISIKNNYIKPEIIKYNNLTNKPKIEEDVSEIKNIELSIKDNLDQPNLDFYNNTDIGEAVEVRSNVDTSINSISLDKNKSSAPTNKRRKKK